MSRKTEEKSWDPRSWETSGVWRRERGVLRPQGPETGVTASGTRGLLGKGEHEHSVVRWLATVYI